MTGQIIYDAATGHVVHDTGWQAPASTGAEREAALAQWRATASADRSLVLRRLGPAGLGGLDLLTEDEVIAAARGDVPPRFGAAVAAMTPEERYLARILMTDATWWRRSPIYAGLGFTAAQLDHAFGWQNEGEA